MLYEIMRHLRNFFVVSTNAGDYEIAGGNISLNFVNAGEYILIEGSRFNDGVYKYPATGLTNETFNGNISVLHPPKEFLTLVAEIEAFNTNNAPSALQNEAFGGYSYTRATNKAGNVATWADVFKTRLNVWRRL